MVRGAVYTSDSEAIQQSVWEMRKAPRVTRTPIQRARSMRRYSFGYPLSQHASRVKLCAIIAEKEDSTCQDWSSPVVVASLKRPLASFIVFRRFIKHDSLPSQNRRAILFTVYCNNAGKVANIHLKCLLLYRSSRRRPSPAADACVLSFLRSWRQP